MGHHHHITWLSHSLLVEFGVLICPVGATGKDDSEGCCKVVVFLGTCPSDFEVPADGFYQVNTDVGEELAKAVMAEYQKGAAEAPEVLDLYCGVGVLGLCCKPPRLTGIESGRQAIEFAKRNAAAQKAADARFFSEQVGPTSAA